jgi:UDP-N-acetylmuramyl pentapeptide phosphotransferase/UDP-N-acetylglucosamine-1-phosphate transferase
VLLLFVAFMTALLSSLLIIRSDVAAGGAIADTQSGPQKIHAAVTPRIGGVAVFLGLAVSALVAALQQHRHAWELFLLVVVALPVFGSGLLEDLTKRVPPAGRMAGAIASAALAIVLLGSVIRRIDIAWIDPFFAVAAVAWVFTAFAIAGMSNAVNIIDGLNGLAGMVVAMMFASLAYVSLLVGDTLVLAISLAMAGAIAGFFIWNFPDGRLFLGDGGAYLLGFVVAVSAILLVARNAGVSAWYPILLFIYPVFETLFSMYRRLANRKTSVSRPDSAHLHSLVYKRLMRLMVGRHSTIGVTRRNSLSAPYLWLLCAMAVGPTTLLWRNTGALMAFSLLFCVTYVWLYRRIVRFQTPRWLVAPRRR